MAGLNTKLIHAGEAPDPTTGAIAPVVVRTKTYKWNSLDADPKYKYSRGANPTRQALEEKLSALEPSTDEVEKYTTTYGSGLAAESAFFLTLSPGDHIILCDEIYGGTYRLFEKILNRFNITHDYADFSNESEESILKKIKPTTRYLFVEPLSNPSLHVTNMDTVRKVSRAAGVPVAVDATFTPVTTFHGFLWGAEVIINSLSKYYCGHNDVLAGSVTTINPTTHDKLKLNQSTLGATLSPDEAYRVLQGIKTLSLRWEKVSNSAMKIAEWLTSQSAVARVLYPGLVTHPHHLQAKKQFTNGYGGVISFELDPAKKDKIQSFAVEATLSGTIVLGESLASPESLLAYPALMSHKSLSVEARNSLHISDTFFRFSVGFEDTEDIINSLARGLNAYHKNTDL